MKPPQFVTSAGATGLALRREELSRESPERLPWSPDSWMKTGDRVLGPRHIS